MGGVKVVEVEYEWKFEYVQVFLFPAQQVLQIF